MRNWTRRSKPRSSKLRKLETERVALIARNTEMQAERDQLVQERREATAAVAATQANNDKLATDAVTLRQQIRNEQQARDAAFNATLAATEELHQLRNEYETALERSQQLTQQNAGMSHIMRAEGLDPEADPSGVVPTVDGIVSQIRRIAGGQLVEVTIGADDGLKEGNTLDVYRGSRYLGRLEVWRLRRTNPSAALSGAIQQGAIQEGDRVATRLTSSDRPRGVLVRQPRTSIYTMLLLDCAVGAGVQLPADGAGIGGIPLSNQAAGQSAVVVVSTCRCPTDLRSGDHGATRFWHHADAASRRAEAADDDLLRAVDYRAGGNADRLPVSVPRDSPLRRLWRGSGTGDVGRFRPEIISPRSTRRSQSYSDLVVCSNVCVGWHAFGASP